MREMKMPHSHKTVDEIQIKIYREMSPERKLEIAIQLFHSAYSLKHSALKSQHPEWSDEEVARELKSILLHART
jgi:hypothetical protein